MALFGLLHRAKDGTETPIDVENVMGDDTQAAAPQPTESAEVARLRADLAAKDREATANAQKAADLQSRLDDAAKAEGAARVSGIHAASATFAEGFGKKLTPAAKDALGRVHAFASLASAGLPALDADGKPIDAAADLSAFCAALPDHGLGGGSVASSEAGNLKPLPNGPAPEDEMAEIRKANDAHFASRGIAPLPAN